MNTPIYQRLVEPRLQEALADSPVVLIQGPRQCGKTMLAQMAGETAGYAYFSFDDEGTKNFAVGDPLGFVESLPERVILDEVQRAPNLFSSIKLSVDRNRKPGRFILTGSMRVLHFSKINDSLAGRMDIIRLHPLAQSEIEQTGPRLLDSLFSPNITARQEWPAKNQIVDRIVTGGYPEALKRPSPPRRARWYKSYIETLIERDVADIAKIASLETLPQLLKLAAAYTAQLLSVNGLASSFQLNRLTIKSYLTLLEKLFLLERLPAWHSNYAKRLVKTPKLHLCDTGVACALLNFNSSEFANNRELFGHILETFVLQELRRQASGHIQPHTFYHFRDREKDRAEVDIVIQRGGTALAGVEVKASATVHTSDFKGLRKFREAAGKQFVSGTLLYNGHSTLSFDKNLYAVPLHSLWEAT